jgi:hypothetical protein
MPRTRRGGDRCSSRHDAGQGLAEYALILSLIVIFSVISLLVMGDQISAILSTIAGQL